MNYKIYTQNNIVIAITSQLTPTITTLVGFKGVIDSPMPEGLYENVAMESSEIEKLKNGCSQYIIDSNNTTDIFFKNSWYLYTNNEFKIDSESKLAFSKKDTITDETKKWTLQIGETHTSGGELKTSKVSSNYLAKTLPKDNDNKIEDITWKYPLVPGDTYHMDLSFGLTGDPAGDIKFIMELFDENGDKFEMDRYNYTHNFAGGTNNPRPKMSSENAATPQTTEQKQTIPFWFANYNGIPVQMVGKVEMYLGDGNIFIVGTCEHVDGTTINENIIISRIPNPNNKKIAKMNIAIYGTGHALIDNNPLTSMVKKYSKIDFGYETISFESPLYKAKQ